VPRNTFCLYFALLAKWLFEVAMESQALTILSPVVAVQVKGFASRFQFSLCDLIVCVA
jgi:hypothetical protein